MIIVRVHGIDGHGKCEVDSCYGGHMKKAVIKKCQMGESIKSAEEAVNYLQKKYAVSRSPIYEVETISTDILEEEINIRK